MRHEAKKHLYPNGLTLIVDEAPQLMSVTIGAWVRTGSRHEDPDSWGMCHFLEHMIFKGGEKRGALDISKAVDRVGGDFNAFTSREHTCFHFYLPAQEAGLGAELLKETLFKPLFETKEIERERQVILQEIAMTKESPEEESFDRFMEKAFDKHPIGRNILGSKESIQGINRKKIREFFLENYRPENMVLAVSGDITLEKAKRTFAMLGEQAWPDRKQPRSSKPVRGSDPPEAMSPGLWWVDEQTEQAHVIYGIMAPVKTQKERLLSAMIQQYLGGGMSSVLFDEIREKKGWAYSVYASAVQFLDSSIFTLYAGVKTDKILETIKVFRNELQKVAKTGIPAKDLKRIKDSLLYSYELSLESSESRMFTVSSSELFFKRAVSFKEYKNQVESIRAGDTQALAKDWLKHGAPSVLVLGPKPKKRDTWNEIKADALKLTGTNLTLEKADQ